MAARRLDAEPLPVTAAFTCISSTGQYPRGSAQAGIGWWTALVTAGLAFWVPVLFTADSAIRHAATVALLVAALTQPMAALAFVLDGLILGLSDYVAMRRAMILAIAAYIPVASLVLVFHSLGLAGIWVALGLWLAARAALLGRCWQAQFGLPAAS